MTAIFKQPEQVKRVLTDPRESVRRSWHIIIFCHGTGANHLFVAGLLPVFTTSHTPHTHLTHTSELQPERTSNQTYSLKTPVRAQGRPACLQQNCQTHFMLKKLAFDPSNNTMKGTHTHAHTHTHTHTHTEPWWKCSRMPFNMFLAKLWLLPLMTPTRRHAEPHTHSHTHSHTHTHTHTPHEGCSQKECSSSSSSVFQQLTEVRRTFASIKILEGKKKTPPWNHFKPFNNQLLVVVLTASGSGWYFCYIVPFFPGCDAESRYFPVWQEKWFPGMKTMVIVKVCY